MSQEFNEFEQLRRLLALKRHEQPPPGYFEHFSREVLVEIRLQTEQSQGRWAVWSRVVEFWKTFEVKPAFAGGVGLAVCGLLVGGAVYLENESGESVAVLPGAENLNPSADTVQVAAGEPVFSPVSRPTSGLRLVPASLGSSSLGGASTFQTLAPSNSDSVIFTGFSH